MRESSRPLRSGATAADVRAVGPRPATKRQRLGDSNRDLGRAAPHPPWERVVQGPRRSGAAAADVRAVGPVPATKRQLPGDGHRGRGRAAPCPQRGLAVRDGGRPRRSGAAAADVQAVGSRPATKRQKLGDSNRDLGRAAPHPPWERVVQGPRRSGAAAADVRAVGPVPATKRQRPDDGSRDRGRVVPRPPRRGWPCEKAAVHGGVRHPAAETTRYRQRVLAVWGHDPLCPPSSRDPHGHGAQRRASRASAGPGLSVASSGAGPRGRPEKANIGQGPADCRVSAKEDSETHRVGSRGVATAEWSGC